MGPNKTRSDVQKPLIGILTSDGNRIFRGNHDNFKDLIQMGRKAGVLICVLTPRSFVPKQQMVQGYILRTNDGYRTRWSKVWLPLPTVIYNRIPNRVVEKRRAEQTILLRLQKHPDVHLFNHNFFNKWDLYQKLYSNEDWRYMVPITKPFEKPETLGIMLDQYPIVFAKPIDGKAGIGLMKIRKKDKQFLLTYQNQQGQKHVSVKNMEQLWLLMKQYTQKKEYILQQGISLAQYQQRPCDFRVLIQKDAQGTWQITGVGVRVAGKNAISTHVPMGGKIANVHQVLKQLFPQNHTYLYKKLKQKAKGIAHFIEQSQNDQLGEMSMDIGIESNGRMWFFEANAKPMKFDEPEIRKLSLQRIIQYARFLTKRQPITGGLKR